MSSAEAISCRILRADTSVSLYMMLERSTTRSTATPHSGFHSISILSAIQVAKDSFSQTSSHHSIVTRSPNHWWAISWALYDAWRLWKADGLFGRRRDQGCARTS